MNGNKSKSLLSRFCIWIKENGSKIFWTIIGIAGTAVYLYVIYLIGGTIFTYIKPWLLYAFYTFTALFVTHIYLLLIITAFTIMIKVASARQRKKLNARFPVIGLPDEDKLIVLLMLFKIRCAEIAEIYFKIGKWQEEAKNDESKDWIKTFIQEFLEIENLPSRYASNSELEKAEKRSAQRALYLAKNKFSFEVWVDDKQYHTAKIDLQIALNKICSIDTITKLKGIRSCGLIDRTISDLIKEYTVFESRSAILFIENKFYYSPFKSKIINAKKNIDQIWGEILLVLRTSLIYIKTHKENNLNKHKIDVDSTLKEIEALSTLERHLDPLDWELITRGDFKPDEAGIDLILSKRLFNPIHKIY